MVWHSKCKAKCICIKIAVSFFLAIMAFTVAMQSSNTIWCLGDSYTDSSVFKYVAFEMLHGGMPYRDTFDHKGPLVYWLNILGMMIDYWRGIWLIEWMVLFVSFFFMYQCARVYCSPLLSLVSVFITGGGIFKYYEGGNLTEEYALPFIAISTYIFLDFFQNGKKSFFRIAICGMCFAAVCLLRPNMIALWLVMCVGVIVKQFYRGSKKELFSCMASFFVGTAAVLLPVLIWLIENRSLTAFIQAYWKYNNLYSSVLSGIYSRKDAMIHFLKDPMVCSVLVFLSFFCAWKRDVIDCLYLIYLFITVGMISLSGKTYMHYGMILVPLVICPISELLGCMQTSAIRGKTVAVIATGASLVLIILVKSAWLSAFHNVFNQYNNIGQNYISPEVRQLSEIVQKYSSENDEITVCGNWNEVYLLSKRRSASRYSYQTVCSISKEMEDEYFFDLENNKPELIVLRSDFYIYDRMIDFVHAYGYIPIGADEKNIAVVYKIGSHGS